MNRKRALGLSTLVVLAVTSIAGASSASASWLIPTQTGKTVLIGEPTGSFLLGFGGSGVIQCTGPIVEAAIEEPVEVAETVAGNASCTILGGKAAVKMNGCGIAFDVNGSLAFGPPSCGPMTITYTLGGCTLSIYPKSGLSATYSNTGSGKTAGVAITMNASGLKYSDSCEVFGSGENGSFTGNWQMRGQDLESNSVGVSIGAKAPNGIFVSGETFAAEDYPVAVTTKMSKPTTFNLGSSTGECTTGKLTALSEYESATSEIWNSLQLEDCNLAGFTAKIHMNSCHFLGMSAVDGDTEVVCFNESDAIVFEPTFFGFPVCTVSIPGQVLGTATYKGTGSGFQRGISATVAGSGIDYAEAEGGGCGVGSGSNGTFSGSFELSGLK